MGKISVGTPINNSLIRCCSCHKGYDIKGNIYENNILVCPYCGLRHKINFTFIDKKIENLKRIDRIGLTVIDIGSLAIYYPDANSENKTYVEKNNPANATGKITSVEIYAYANITGCKVGTFYVVSGDNLTCRDYEAIPGTITSGAKRTFTVDIEVVEGDYIGIYFTGGTICHNPSVGTGRWWQWSDRMPCTNTTFLAAANCDMSIYGTGATEGDFTYTGTGSFTYSGAATYQLYNYVYEGTGTLTYSGIATQVYTMDFVYTGSGSLTYSGEGSYSLYNYEYAGSGGIAFSGSAITIVGFAYASTGGLAYSGTAIQLHTKVFVYASSGSLGFSGAATYSYTRNFVYVTSGDFTFSGMGTYILGFAVTGSGTLVYSGAADFPATRPANIYYLVSKPANIYYERVIPALTSHVVSVPDIVYYEVSL